jgi:hypothetical protein
MLEITSTNYAKFKKLEKVFNYNLCEAVISSEQTKEAKTFYLKWNKMTNFIKIFKVSVDEKIYRFPWAIFATLSSKLTQKPSSSYQISEKYSKIIQEIYSFFHQNKKFPLPEPFIVTNSLIKFNVEWEKMILFIKECKISCLKNYCKTLKVNITFNQRFYFKILVSKY